MARRSYRPARYGRKQRSTRLYLGVAVVVCAAVVYLLVRGPSGPEKAAAGDAGPAADANAAQVNSTPANPIPAAPIEPAESPSEPTRTEAQAPPVESRPIEPTPQPSTPVMAAAPSPQEVSSVQSARPATPKPDNARAAALVAEANGSLNARPRQIISARDKLNQALAITTAPEQAKAIKAQMAELSKEWLFGPAAIAGDELCDTYTVKRGDSFAAIGGRFKVPYEILMTINNIPRPESLPAGRPIKVVKGPFHVKVYRSTFTMDLYLRDTYVRSFTIGIGRAGHETPTGTWRVKEDGKLIKPTWTDPDTGRLYKASDPDYPLGSRWIALDGIDGAARGRTGFAIHGTKDPDQIGGAVSRGCIRMYNGEAILVYNMLYPLYSKVEVFD